MQPETPLVVLEINLLADTLVWFLDFGATDHVTGDLSLLTGVKLVSRTPMIAACGEPHVVAREGKAMVNTSNGSICNIEKILYIPGICHSLLFVGYL